MNAQTGSTKIRWTVEERSAVIDYIVERMLSASFDRGEFSRLLSEAQLRLPAHRRRTQHAQMSAELSKLALAAYKKRPSTGRQAPATAPAAPVPQEAETSLTMMASAIDLIARVIQRERSALVEEVSSAVAARLQPALSALQKAAEARADVPGVAAGAEPPTDRALPGAKPATSTQPTVLIIGTWGDLRQQLLKDYRGTLNLRFYDDVTGSAGLAVAARGCDAVFLRSKSARHSHQAALRSANIKFTLVSGGLSSLRRVLDDFALNTEPHAV